jgi:hypothetical protein
LSPNNGDLSPVPLTAGVPLGLGDIGPIAGFDIAGTNNVALAAVNLAGAATSDLENINLITGVATRVNTIGGGERVRELTMTAIPTATVFGLTGGNTLVSFSVATPTTLAATTPITGLQGGESVIGLDFRPANGKLYAATTGGRVYIVNPTTGAAATPVTLTAATGTTPAFTALSGTLFGVDFNPAADRLRIVSNTGQDLRINVDSGATTVDGNINPGTPMVTEVAYTSSYAPTPPATKLFDIDLATSSLQQQNPPNNGTLVPVGPLDPTVVFTGMAGFDIAGGDDGLSLASLTATGATQSTLYRVNLKTGATTSIGLIGPAGTAVLQGLTIQLK